MSMLGQDGSPCLSASLQWWPHGVRSRSLGYLLLVPGWRLGLLTEGKTARTNRVEAWTSYRGEDCEKNQGGDCDIKQGVDLREVPGCLASPKRPLLAVVLPCRTFRRHVAFSDIDPGVQLNAAIVEASYPPQSPTLGGGLMAGFDDGEPSSWRCLQGVPVV